MSALDETLKIALDADKEIAQLKALNAELAALLKAAVRLTELNQGLNHQWLKEARAAIAKARN